MLKEAGKGNRQPYRQRIRRGSCLLPPEAILEVRRGLAYDARLDAGRPFYVGDSTLSGCRKHAGWL